MTKTILIDDDASCRQTLKELLAASGFKIKIVAECASVDDAKEAIIKLQPNLVFLDVEMPLKNGFDLLNELDEINFDVVFTTAYERYAIKAIKASALDFLLKPIEQKDLMETLLRFEAKKNKTQTLRQVEVLLESYGQVNGINKTIAVPTSEGIEFIRTNQIIRLEASNNYTTFFLADKTKLTVAKTLKDMEELLSEPPFYRVHNSHLINIDFIKRFVKADGGTLLMNDNSEIPISRQRKENLVELLKK